MSAGSSTPRAAARPDPVAGLMPPPGLSRAAWRMHHRLRSMLGMYYDVMVANGDQDKQVWSTEAGAPTGTYVGITIEQKIACRNQPIADVMSENSAAGAGARNLSMQFRVPPDMVGVDCDSHSVAKKIAEVQRLFERVNAGAIGGVHWMERLDRQRHPVRARMRQNCSEAIGHHLAR